MAIIYTYPDGPSPLTGGELIIISDPNNSNSTRNVTAQNIANLADINITFNPGTTGLNYSPNITQLTETVTLSGVLQETHGGTGIGVGGYTTGDMLYADAIDSLSVIGIGATGHVLTSNGTIPTCNTTGGTDIVLQNDIVESGGNGLIRLGQDSTNYALLSTDSGNYATTYLWVSDVSGLEAYGPVGIPCNLNFGGNVTLRGSTIKLGTTGNTGNLGELDMDALTAQRKFDFQDEDGVIPVGPAWNTLIANPTPTEDGYVITWDNTAGEYQLLVAGAGSNGIYGGSGSLPVAANVVTMPSGSSLAFDGVGFGDLFSLGKTVGNDSAGFGGESFTSKLYVTSTNSNHTNALQVVQAQTNTWNYGIRSSVIGAGTNNVGLQVSSTNATNNYAIITDGGQSGFGTTTPDPSAIVDVSSATQGFKVPVVNGTGTVSPAPTALSKGLIIFDDSTSQFMGYNGASWVILG